MISDNTLAQMVQFWAREANRFEGEHPNEQRHKMYWRMRYTQYGLEELTTARVLLERAHSILSIREAAEKTHKGQALLTQIADLFSEWHLHEPIQDSPVKDSLTTGEGK